MIGLKNLSGKLLLVLERHVFMSNALSTVFRMTCTCSSSGLSYVAFRLTALVIFFKQKTAYEIGVRLVGSEMCIRDSIGTEQHPEPINASGLYL